jgi:SAM-dependent methyltransferase
MPSESIVATIMDVARARAPGGPFPRGLPYLGLDHRSGTALRLLDELSSRGIFRKYEHVLDLGSGLGATTRYLVARLGCSATGTAPTAHEAAMAHTLTQRAGLDWNASHVAASGHVLPFGDAAFTHVWILESLRGLGAPATVMAEAVRVLRPGGHFGLQDLVTVGNDPALDAAGFATCESRTRGLEATGLVEITMRDLTRLARDEDVRVERAWEALSARLGANDAFVWERERLRHFLAQGRLRVVQLTGRKP